MYLPTDLETVLATIYVTMQRKYNQSLDNVDLAVYVAIGDLWRSVEWGEAIPVLLIA